VLAELLEIAPSGVEEVDAPDGHAGVVEYAVYGAPGELPELGALERMRATRSWRCSARRCPTTGRALEALLLPRARCRADLRAAAVGAAGAARRGRGGGDRPRGRLRHRHPSDHAHVPGADAPNTGQGWFARLPLLRDLGCGSGVLAIAAAKLGFEPVLGVDADRAAIGESDRNGRANYVQLELRHMTSAATRRPSPPWSREPHSAAPPGGRRRVGRHR